MKRSKKVKHAFTVNDPTDI
jgi:tetratricopeptide (TPR) repeat protein